MRGGGNDRRSGGCADLGAGEFGAGGGGGDLGKVAETRLIRSRHRALCEGGIAPHPGQVRGGKQGIGHFTAGIAA